MHRKAKKAFGIIFLILAIITAIAFGAVFLFLSNKNLILSLLSSLLKLSEDQANTLYDQLAAIFNNFKLNILLGIVASFLLLVALMLFASSSVKNTEKKQKQYNPFKLPKETYNLHYKAFPLIIVGLLGYIASIFLLFINDMSNIAIYVALGAGVVLFLSTLLMMPVSISRGIKCKRVADKYEIRVPKNSLLTGRFMPYQICSQLQKAYNLGFDRIQYWEGFQGNIQIILTSSRCKENELETIERNVKKNKNLPGFYSLDCMFTFKIEKDTSGMHTGQYHKIDRYLITKRKEEPAYLQVNQNGKYDKTSSKERFIFHFFGLDGKRLVDHDGNWCIAFVTGNKFNLNEINPKQ